MRLSEVQPNPGRVKERKRVGRGHSAGGGKTAGRGMKGEKARDTVKPGFAGRNVPLARRLPKKRGQSNKAHNIGIFRREYVVVNVGSLERFADDTVITPELLLQERVVRDLHDGLKVLGDGELTRRLRVQAHAFSESARQKIEAAGGTAEVIGA
ncbi:MAG: 50S ribosomal protein L15 [Armatimonadetes bacterium]|nr:50S ribosomal protein L15 [Armatimonadota bacterium]